MKTKDIIGLLKKGEVEAALNSLDNVPDRKTAASELTDFAVLLLETKGHPDLCVAILLKSFMLDSDNADTCHALGDALSHPWFLEEDSDNSGKALFWYDEALKRNPGLVEARYNKALLLFFLGRMKECRSEYAAVCESDNHPKYRELGYLLRGVSDAGA